MDRDLFKRLHEWRKSPRRKPLVLNGARQVGKTFALKHFGKTAYAKMAYLNFEHDNRLAEYFQEALNPQDIVKRLSIYLEVDIRPEDTLLIFDEVQKCPRALNSLKYFCEDAPHYSVCAAGSLLGVTMGSSEGFPVGKVNFLNLYPLSFFEFLSALGQEKTRQFLEELTSYEPIPSPLHDKLLNWLRLYLFIGGMPEAIAEYVTHENMSTVREVQKEILNSYERDFSKHAPPHEINNILTVWGQVHRQLAKENKKFIFAAIRKSARGRDYEAAIQWLLGAGIIHKSFLVSSPKFPLSAYADTNIFKLFLLDVGLLGAQSGLSAKAILEGDLLFTEFKGALTENYVAQELMAAEQQKLYYWASEGEAEVDFLIEREHAIYPLEVKSGTSQKKKSLRVYQEKYGPRELLRTGTLNLKHDADLINYPLYLVSRLLTS